MTKHIEKITFLAIRLFRRQGKVLRGLRYYVLKCKCVRYQEISKNGKSQNSSFFLYRDPLDGKCEKCCCHVPKEKKDFHLEIDDSIVSPGIILKGDIDEEAIIQVNERYQKAITSIISLSTGFLAFTMTFLGDVLNIKEKTGINATLTSSWLLLGGTIGFCLLYFYCSARFIKTVAGLEESQWWCKNSEKSCDYSFRFALIYFAFATIFFMIYAI